MGGTGSTGSAGGGLLYAGPSGTVGPPGSVLGSEMAPQQSSAAQRRRERKRLAERLHQEGRDLYDQGNVEQAIPRLEQAMQMWDALLLSEEAGVAAHDLGVAYYASERHGAAIQAYEAALAIYRQLEGRDLEARVLDHLGRAYEGLGKYVTATEQYQASLQIWSDLGNQEEAAPTLKRLAAAQTVLGSYTAALKNYRRAFALFGELGNQEELEDLQNAIADLERLAGSTGSGTGAS